MSTAQQYIALYNRLLRSMAQTEEAIELGNLAVDQAHKYRSALRLIAKTSPDVEAVRMAKEALR